MKKMTRTNLVAASRQWAERPADQRFWTLAELLEKSKRYAEETVVKPVALNSCKIVELPGNDLGLQGLGGSNATFQHYSFGQLCNIAQAPAAFLREEDADLVAPILTRRLERLPGGKEQQLMFHKNGGLELRCITSEQYSRIWNFQVAEMALALEEQEGWMTPPARPCGLPDIPVRTATKEDVLRKSAHESLGIREGDEISPAGLYCSDHDLFIFQVNEDYAIDAGGGEMLYRGVFWSNSEVGDARFRGTMFLYDSICGNHIVWGARIISEISIRHTGTASTVFREAMAAATVGVLRAASEDEDRIKAAKMFQIAPSKPEVIQLVFKKQWGLSKEQCENAYVLAERHAEEHGTEPNTAWGYAAGVTRLSQNQYADKRDQMDRVAGRIMEMAF